MNIDRQHKLLHPKRFRFHLNPNIFVYHPLPQQESDQLLNEWKKQDELRRRKLIPLYRERFLLYHKRHLQIKRELASLVQQSNTKDMAEAKQWYWVIKEYPFDYRKADRKANELRLQDHERLMAREIDEWLWCAERLAYLRYLNNKYADENVKRLIKYNKIRHDTQFEITKIHKHLVHSQTNHSRELRVFIESRNGLIFDISQILTMEDPSPHDVRDMIIRAVQNFNKQIQKRFLQKPFKFEHKRKMFELTLVQEATKAAFNSIINYLKAINSMKGVVQLDCSVVDMQLYFQTQYIKEQFKAGISSVARLDWVKFSDLDIEEWQQRVDDSIERQLDIHTLAAEPFLQLYKHIITDEKPDQSATETELLEYHKHNKYLLLKLQKAPQTIPRGLFMIRMEAVWKSLEVKLRNLQNYFTARIRKTLTAQLKSLADDFREYDRTLIFRSINPALMLANKAKVNQMLENEVVNSVLELLDLYDRIVVITQSISLEPSQNDMLMTLAQLRMSQPQLIKEHKRFFDKRISTFTSFVNKKQTAVLANAQKIADKLKILQTMGSPQESAVYLTDLAELKPLLYKLILEIDDLNQFEKVVSITVSDVPKMRHAVEDVNIMEQLFQWTDNYLKHVEEFFDSRRTVVNVEESRTFVDEYLSKLSEFESRLGRQRAARHFIVYARTDADVFKKNFSVAEVMSCKRLLDRHWIKMSEIVGFDMSVHANSCVSVLCELGLDEYLAQLKPIAFAAEREAILADQLHTVIAHWTTAHFDLSNTEYWNLQIPVNLRELTKCAKKDKECLQLNKETEDIDSYTNEMIVKWFSIVTYLEKLLAKWSDLLEDWLRVAKIFKTAKSELKDTFQLFRRCGKLWRRLEDILKQDSSVVRIIDVKHTDCWLNTLQKHMKMIVEKVRHHLHNIRLAEPRLLICSDYDLVTLFSANSIEETLRIILSEAFPQYRRLAINRHGGLEFIDRKGDKIVLEDVNENILKSMGPCEIIKTIETTFNTKVVELLTLDRSEHTRALPKIIERLTDSLEFINEQDNIIISRMEKSFYIQHKPLVKQATLTLDFINLMEPTILPIHFCDCWANGQFLLLVGKMTDNRYFVQNLSQRLFSSVRYINCHSMVEDKIFKLLVQASLKESFLLVLENVDYLSPHAFFALLQSIGGVATQEHPFPRLLMTSTSVSFHQSLNAKITVLHIPSRLQTPPTDQTAVSISPTAFQVVSPESSTPLREDSRIRKTTVPSKSALNQLIEDINSRSVSACVGPMAKIILKQALEKTSKKTDWIYVDAMAISEMLAPSERFAYRAGGLLMDILAENTEQSFQDASTGSSTVTCEMTDDSQRIVVFYGHNIVWTLFPCISSLFERFDGNLIPTSYLSLFDGSTLRTPHGVHCILCIPDESGIHLETVAKFGIPYKKFDNDMNRSLNNIFKEKWKAVFEDLLIKANYNEVMHQTVELVVAPLCTIIQDIDIMDLIMRIFYQEISELITVTTPESLREVIISSLVVTTANLLALNTSNRQYINEKIYESSQDQKLSLPPDVTSYRIGNGEYRLVRWSDEPCAASSMDKYLRMNDLMVVLPEFDRALYYGLRMLSLGKNLIISGPPFTLKTTLVKMLERELSSLGASFYWLGSQWRVDLQSVQQKFANIIEDTKNVNLQYIVIDKFSAAELLLPIIELFVDHQLYYSEGGLKRANVQLKFILITEEDDWIRIKRGHFFYESFSNLPMRAMNNEDSKILIEKLLQWNFTIKSFSSEYQKLVDPLASAIIHIASRPYVKLYALPVMIRLVKALQFAFPDNSPDTLSFIRLFIHETYRVILDSIDFMSKNEFVQDIREILAIEFKTTEVTLLEGLQLQSEDHTKMVDVEDGVGLEKLLFSEMDANETVDGLRYIAVKNIKHFNRTIENFQFEHHRNHPRDRILLAIDEVVSFNIQRVCRVMRQAGEHLCISGLPGSGRTQTVRLATAAHNALLLNLYLEPSSFDSFMRAWNSVLSPAILSIACNNQPVNILINMDYCYERVEPRWMEYIRLWLESPQTSSLLSDEQLLGLGEAVIEAEKTLASQMQSASIRLPGQRLCKFMAVEVLKEPDQLRNVLEARIHDFLHCIFLINPQYKTDFSWCTVVEYKGADSTAWIRICTKQISDCKLTLDTVPQLLQKIFNAADEYLGKIESVSWMGCLVTKSNRFYTMVERFQKLYQTQKTRITAENRQLSTALTTIQKIRECAVIGQSIDGEDLEKRLKNSELELSQIAQQLDEKSERLDTLQKNLVLAEQEAAVLSDSIKLLSTEVESQLKEPYEEFTRTSAALREYSVSEYKKFSQLAKPSLGCRYVAEMLRVIFVLGFKPNRNTRDTWLQSQKFLRSPGLINMIIACHAEALSLEQIQILSKYVSSRELRIEKIKAESDVAGSLCQWIMSVLQLACTSSLLKEQQEELREMRVKCLQLDSQVIHSNDEISQLQDDIQKLNDSLRDGELAIVNDRRLNEYRTRTGPILQIVEKYERIWNSQFAHNTRIEKTLIGDSIMLAAFQTIAVQEKTLAKQALVQLWKDVFVNHGVQFSNEMRKPSQLMTKLISNLTISRKFSLLIDETDSLLTSLVEIFPNSTTVNMTAINWNSPEVVSSMIKYIYSGVPTILKIDTGPSVEYYSILSKWSDMECRFYDRTIELPDDCLIIFVTNHILKLTPLLLRIMDVILVDEGPEKFDRSSMNYGLKLLQMFSEFSVSDMLESAETYEKILHNPE